MEPRTPSSGDGPRESHDFSRAVRFERERLQAAPLDKENRNRGFSPKAPELNDATNAGKRDTTNLATQYHELQHNRGRAALKRRVEK